MNEARVRKTPLLRAALPLCKVLHDLGGAWVWDDDAQQQQRPERRLGVYTRSLQRAFHGVESAFELLLGGHKIARAGSE